MVALAVYLLSASIHVRVHSVNLCYFMDRIAFFFFYSLSLVLFFGLLPQMLFRVVGAGVCAYLFRAAGAEPCEKGNISHSRMAVDACVCNCVCVCVCAGM